jgi:hypothetical protein
LVIVISYSIIGTMTFKKKGSVIVIDWVVSKPYLAFGGVLSTLLAIISAIGLGLHIGILFIDMVIVVPFLIICKQFQHFCTPYVCRWIRDVARREDIPSPGFRAPENTLNDTISARL